MYVPKEQPADWLSGWREFSRYGYDPYNSLDVFKIWLRHNARPE